jgi:ribonuclease H / adenosylcobalamin/alpha-ribazole phosphatase
MTGEPRFVVHIDGGARGNPGPAGWGAVILGSDGQPRAELLGSLPYATNNVAEYHALIAALEWCAEHRATAVLVYSDSQLLVQQMGGVYKVRNEGLKPLYARARLLEQAVGTVSYHHVPRESNRDADRLANRAMDEAAG